jgi:Bacterial Ig domain
VKIRLLVVCVLLFAGLCSAQRIVRHKLGGVKIGFQQDTTPPVTAITSPANLATVNGTISVTATSSDNVGVVKLELYVDASLYSTILTPASPATFTWNTSTYSNASHTLQTKAYDAAANTGTSTVINVTVNNTSAAGVFYAALPTSWVDNTICNPPGGVYDTVVTIGTTVNLGPNASTGDPVGSPYVLTPIGLRDAVRNWRDNADNVTPNPTPHYVDKWWLIKVPAQGAAGTTYLHGSSYVGNALVTMSGKLNPANNSEPSKCLVIESTTPLNRYTVAGSVTSGTFTSGERVRQGTTLAETTLNNAVTGSNPMLTGPMTGYYDASHTWVGQSSGAVFTPTAPPSAIMACGRGLPGFGGTRNPGCDGHVAGPNDKASMWKLQQDIPIPQPGYAGIAEGPDYENPLGITGSCLTYTNACLPYTNHVVIRDYKEQCSREPLLAQTASRPP